MFQRVTIPESDVYYLLSNRRRREALSVLWEVDDTLTLRSLSEHIASVESEMTPAPRPLRESVYNALHQTHLPKLAAYGLIEYDSDRKLVRPNPESRSLSRYMNSLTPIGISWGEYYRALGILGLCAVVASLAAVPPFAAVDPLIPSSIALASFALSTLYQMRDAVSRPLRSARVLFRQYLE